MTDVLASVAQYETEVRRERQQAGISKARDLHGGARPWDGRKTGTRVKVIKEKEAAIRTMRKEARAIA